MHLIVTLFRGDKRVLIYQLLPLKGWWWEHEVPVYAEHTSGVRGSPSPAAAELREPTLCGSGQPLEIQVGHQWSLCYPAQCQRG